LGTDCKCHSQNADGSDNSITDPSDGDSDNEDTGILARCGRLVAKSLKIILKLL
jgi:hypothetical protein